MKQDGNYDRNRASLKCSGMDVEGQYPICVQVYNLLREVVVG